ncbi:MAG: hypothetical protein K2N27_11045 [Ruminococcus sp.]|nr:hypothetical protein [Ruminococcus sp.]
MMMNGEYLENLDDLKRCFSIDELLYNYESGGLEIWLEKIGEAEKAEKIRSISKIDANILVRLYEVFGLDLNMSEEEIRESVTLK